VRDLSRNSSTGAAAGIGSGSIIAGLISWEYTKSVLWTLLHAIFGWVYVIYSLIVHKAHLL